MAAKSVTTLCFRPFQLEQALEGAASAGFTHVEICAIKDFAEHADPDDLGPTTVRKVKKALADNGLSPVSVAGHTDMLDAEGFERHLRLLGFTAEIGAKYLNTFAGDARKSDERPALVRSARRLGDRAVELGLEVCLENDGGEAGTGKALSELLREIGHEGVAVVYDAANAVFIGGADPGEDMRYVLPWTRQVHVKDKRGGKGVTDFPPLGDGDIAWPELLHILDAYGYDGPRCLEIEFDGSWPGYLECVAAVNRSRKYWDAIDGDP